MRRIEHGMMTDAALALFDGLPAVPVEAMIGGWRGSGVATGHPLDGMLELAGWHGKRFDVPDDAHPLVFAKASGALFSIDPALIPMGLLVRHASSLKTPALARAFRAVAPLMRTSRPKARLRRMDYRGVVTATMIYDALPIHDSFRRLDQDTLMGVMDLRYTTKPFVFMLRREAANSLLPLT